MKLLLKDQIATLQAQHRIYAETEMKDLTVAVKLFALNSGWTWYLLTQDPDDPDYLWAIVDGNEIEMGSVSLADLESQRWLGIPAVERDRYWKPRNAQELWNKLNGITVKECGCKASKDGTVFSPCEAHQEVETEVVPDTGAIPATA